ncbi:MAG: hypothetical protein ACSHXG_15870 [Maribacter stanieri]
MNIPLNGRIAIIDDKVEQAEPLMQVLSKNQMPYVFYKGNDLNYLPEEDNRYNDIRILFLDINLLDDTAKPDEKQIKSILYNVLKRVISPDNFPYSIIFWSRHQDEHSNLVVELFENELKDRKPISMKGFVKSDFFPNFSTELVENEINILEELQAIIDSQPAYSYILNWENQLHLSADNTLQDVFSSYHSFNDWKNNANFILSKLGNAYLGKHFNNSSDEEKIKSSLVSFSSVFRDSLEHSIHYSIIKTDKLEYNFDEINSSVKTINEKLNISRNSSSISESGNVVILKENEQLFKDLLNKVVSFFGFKNRIKLEKPDITESVLKKEATKEHKRIKTEIKAKWLKIGLIVTPVCDFAQNNKYFDRIVNGLLIPIEYQEYIEDKSEAVYLLPISIQENDVDYLLVLDFRYFETYNLTEDNTEKVLFRVRQELLAEIQSKLARHINRQGILFLDEHY